MVKFILGKYIFLSFQKERLLLEVPTLYTEVHQCSGGCSYICTIVLDMTLTGTSTSSQSGLEVEVPVRVQIYELNRSVSDIFRRWLLKH